jgi:hypothetical protein
MAPPINTVLKIYVPSQDNTLRMFYTTRADAHNTNITSDMHPDSGFDLAIPTTHNLIKHWGNKIPLGIHASMWTKSTYTCSNTRDQSYPVEEISYPQAYYLYPRSSISKTPMRLANSVGIIDSGYRGQIMAVVDVIDQGKIPYEVTGLDRHFQICHPNLAPFKVEVVNSLDELGATSRGDGGFGSTGR